MCPFVLPLIEKCDSAVHDVFTTRKYLYTEVRLIFANLASSALFILLEA